jgi:membrane protease YdiL (CAAX protease family)
MSSAELAETPATPSPKQPRTWKLFGTAIWGGLAFGAMSFAQVFALILILGVYTDLDVSEANLKAIAQHGGTIAVTVLAGLPVGLAVLWIAIRLARRSFASYLALRWPSWRQIGIALAASAVLLLALDGAAYMFGYPLAPDFSLNSMRSARDSGLIWLTLIGFCFAAPLGEELIFRGFVYRGWASTFLKPAGAVVLSAALFALIHVQYEWFYVGGIFTIGLLFGYLRAWSHSTWLTVITHAFYNLVASLQALWFIS